MSNHVWWVYLISLSQENQKSAHANDFSMPVAANASPNCWWESRESKPARVNSLFA
jgi:hypothetical protein